MLSAYETYRKDVEQYVKNNKEVIDEVNKVAKQIVFPQHILWAKNVCSELETDEAKTLRIEDDYFFTEKLVNKLMMFAYLKGERKQDINKESYEKGWSDCMDDVADKLGLNNCDECCEG